MSHGESRAHEPDYEPADLFSNSRRSGLVSRMATSRVFARVVADRFRGDERIAERSDDRADGNDREVVGRLAAAPRRGLI